MIKTKHNPSDILKEFNLTDDQILSIILEDNILEAAKSLRYALDNKWRLDMYSAVNIVKSLRIEFNL